MALIELNDVSKIYSFGDEELHALDHVSLKIEDGDYVTITGPSGCGKSTLMNILGLLDKPTEGDYQLNAKNMVTLSDTEMARMRNHYIGFVFQSFNLLPRYTVRRNVEMPLVYSVIWNPTLKKKKRQELADIALERVHLGNRGSHRPTQLSGGQRQRVAIARALVTNPRVILADEPTGNLDSKTGQAILKIFEELNDQGVTLIMVTHDQSIAERSKKTIRMLDGKIIEEVRR